MDESPEGKELRSYVEKLRAPVVVDPGIRERVMRAARETGAPPRASWLERSVAARLRGPLFGALALTAAAVVLVVASTRGARRDDGSRTAAESPGVVQFVVVASGAKRVTLVGDFNGWDPAANPLRPAGAAGVWMANVALPPGRYHYTYMVDGAHWLTDPAAPRATSDDYGPPSSVLTVMRRGL